MNILCATAISAICSHHKPMHQRANAAVVHDSSLHIVGIMKIYGCDGAKQLEEYFITWGINNFFYFFFGPFLMRCIKACVITDVR